MQKYWRPGLRVWWRCDGEVQLGLDPPAILFGLSRADHELLDALAQADPQLDCWSVAQRLGWKRAAFTRFLRRLPPHALVDAPTPEATPMRRYWSLMEAAGGPHRTARISAEVVIDGVDALGIQLTDVIAAAGVDTVFLHDPRPVLPHDVSPGGFHTDDVGRVREQAALHRLRPRHPMAKLRAGRQVASTDGAVAAQHPSAASREPSAPGRNAPGHSPPGVYAPHLRAAHPSSGAATGVSATLAVLIAHGAVEPRRARPYATGETPVLPVVVREVDVVIGPLLHAGGPCVRCLHLALTDEDPRWPAVATQLACDTNPGIDPVVSHLAAALAAHQVIAIADERPAAVAGRSLHVDGAHPVPRHRAWGPHARCGCQLAHLKG